VLLDGAAAPELAARILTAEQRFRDLSAVARSERSGLSASHNEPLRRRLLLLEACEQWARELGEISLQSVKLHDPALIQSAREAVARIDATLPGLINHMSNRSAAPPVADEPAGVVGEGAHDGLSNRAVRLLLRIDAALVHIALRSDPTQRFRSMDA
jgi:hypothetical protein